MASATGLGDVASSIAQPIDMAGHLLSDVALLVGLVCLVASLFRYVQHRNNPLAFPLSTVVAFFLMGAAFVCFPIVYKHFEQPETTNQSPSTQTQASGVAAPVAVMSGSVAAS